MKLKIFLTSVFMGLIIAATVHAEDISEWAYPEYSNAVSSGVITYDVITKNLKEAITREEFCELSVALYEKLSGDTAKAPVVSPFSDSDNPAVSSAYFYGLVSGTSDDTFEPNRFVTRQEMAKILENVLNVSEMNYSPDNSKLPLFNDVSEISDWAMSSVSVVTRYSIMGGSDGSFDPSGNTTREQAIISVYRTYEAFAKGEEKNYSIKASSPVDGQVITNGECRISVSLIANAKKYFIIIKDENGDTVKSMTISSPSAFTINKSTLPYGENYSLTVGAAVGNTEFFSTPISFDFKEPEITEAPVIITSGTDEKQQLTENTVINNEEAVLTPAVKSDSAENTVSADNEEIGYDDEITTEKAKAILAEAEKYIGIPYVYGGTTPEGFDCSGFVQYVFAKFDISLKRVSRDQYAYCGTKVEKKDLQPGDLVFFGTDGVVGHVGIYAGNGKMIHSPSTGKSICYTSIETSYYKSHYIGAKRVL